VEKSNEIERVSLIQEQTHRTLRSGYLNLIKRATSKGVLEGVAASMQTSNIERVLRVADVLAGEYANLLSNSFIIVANKEADVMADRLASLRKAGENLDLTDQRIIQMLSRNKVNLTLNLTRQQRDAIRTALITGLQRGETSEQIARRFRNVLGLTVVQQRALDKYQLLLEQTSRSALSYALRNPKFDSIVERAIDENDVLTATQIERMVGAYAMNLRTARAETIASTEGLKLVNQARNLAVRQASEAAGLVPSRGRKRWLPTSSADPRLDHAAMVGVEVPMDEPFKLPGGVRMMYPGDTSLGAGPRQVVNCKCGIEYIMEE
jgi:hypothetical protein